MAVEEWRATRLYATPPPHLLLDLLVPGAKWIWTVACTLQRLEAEDLSRMVYPLPAATVRLIPGAHNPHVIRSRERVCSAAHPLPNPLSTPCSASTSEWLRILEEGISMNIADNANRELVSFRVCFRIRQPQTRSSVEGFNVQCVT
ncbi:hypothetical protein KC19_VG074200 [Ceratodon purpureus]|uniref:Uncharacterized protein n=1 Tax=Ceratodon purpureus TaxID=3225 RepID=A0A8T0HMR0_CERPU|nr:hypothetical protein KC19_VG074200 [Ceratodon purpureus]